MPAPVLLVEVRWRSALTKANNYGRASADTHMRSLYAQMLADCRIPTLHGVSAFGSKLAFYEGCVSTRRIAPPQVLPADPDLVSDRAPYSRWAEHDVLDPGCVRRLQRLFALIQSECRDLRRSAAA